MAKHDYDILMLTYHFGMLTLLAEHYGLLIVLEVGLVVRFWLMVLLHVDGTVVFFQVNCTIVCC